MSARPALLRCAFAVLAALAGTAQATTTFYVTRFDDPAPDGCATNDCSLREAVLAANALDGYDNVVLDEGIYTLSRGALHVTGLGQLTLLGQGATNTKIVGDGVEPLLIVDTISALYLKSVLLAAHGQDAVHVNADGNALIRSVRILASDTPIRAIGGDSSSVGRMTIDNSEIHSAVECGRLLSCQIQNSLMLRVRNTGHSALTMTASTIDGSFDADADSGLIAGGSGAIKITDSVIRNTTLGANIASATPDHIQLLRVKYLDNAAPIHLGGASTTTLVDSLFQGNLNENGGPGALLVDAPGAECDVIGSTFLANTGSGDVGGAVAVKNSAVLRIGNSTFFNNGFTAGAAAAHARGAAIGFRMSGSDVTYLGLKNVTVVAPSIPFAGVVGTTLGGYGSGNRLTLLANDSILMGSCGLDADALADASSFYNIESGHSCGFNPEYNLLDVSADAVALGTLGDHGGPTPTFLPAPGSVAIDAGSLGPTCVAIDQRGYPRPITAYCDIGAVEVEAETIFADGFD